MNAFIISFASLVPIFIFYGKITDWEFGENNSPPASKTTMGDNVDFFFKMLLKIFLIQLLNIAPLGPVFGFAIFFLAVGMGWMMIIDGLPVSELLLVFFHKPNAENERFPLFPKLFATIASGAITGVHFKKTPMMVHWRNLEISSHSTFYYLTPKI